MAIKGKAEDFEWTPEEEVQLFFALEGLHPFGLNKHFSMALLVDRLNGPFRLSQEVTSETIWAKLQTLYDFSQLKDLDDATIESETFSLPEGFTCKTSEEEPPEQKPVEVKVEIKTEPPVKHREEKRNPTPSRDSEVKRMLPKRTRGSTSLESSSSSPTTLTPNTKRRRI